MKWILTGAVVGLAALLIGVAAMLTRDGASTREYDHAEPGLVIEAAAAMIEAGDAERLHELIHADSDEMRSVLMRLGKLLGSVQSLAGDINAKFPEEVAQLRARAESNQAAQNLSAMFAGGTRERRQGREDAERASQELIKLLLADPYGWIERNKDRVTALETADDTAAIMVDGKPALGVGLLMRRDAGRWRIALPLNFPGVAKYTPRDRDEWQILASMITVFDNAVMELASDVRSGRAASIGDVSRLAGEKAAIPMIICFVAYERAMNARELDAAGGGGGDGP